MPDDPAPAVTEIAEDIADLQAQVRALTARLDQLTRADDPDRTSAESPEEERGGAEGAEGDSGEPEWASPPFIFILDPPAYDDELCALAEWVEGVLVPGYLSEPSADARWCHLWTEHPVAVARLHALWLAWQELTDPASCGYTGPSTWHRDHYDPCMRELRLSGGPFNGCTKGEHSVMHRQPGLVPSAWKISTT
ncbi:DUF4913 domain-containing protein [Streptomyces sp. OUCMDZ-4982]|uniref:DUF4913 domain-containing protein n=1 Tax=Streptomyces sp. OUCMDZ-4982 TaxID=2973090 RepID=UPI00215CA38A|nr:DUF4913 domain-containing protein [Streptomyces sp. OUCMDZ-4982]MCR8945183.1 DUF4913 domain-containing protein [Streptomyces sp. OUCMDZ-4982]